MFTCVGFSGGLAAGDGETFVDLQEVGKGVDDIDTIELIVVVQPKRDQILSLTAIAKWIARTKIRLITQITSGYHLRSIHGTCT